MGSNRAICTIIAGNYLAYARVLCESYLAMHPGDRCFVLVVDDLECLIDPAGEPFELVRPQELGVPDYHPHFTFKYNVTELSTAVKPPLMELLLRDRGVEKLLYLDPDILVTGSLDPLYDSLDHADAVVTPHLDVDFPEDGLLPNDAVILKAGIFNLGFLGVSGRPPAREFLGWWRGKLVEKCLMDMSTGYFVDQKFIDLAIGLFPGFHIERDPGYNVAYWNLHGRRVAREDGVWRCNGAPLRFFHFSGINIKSMGQISKYQTRFTLSMLPDLAPLFQEYCERVLARGHEAARAVPYGHGRFSDTGKPITDRHRLAYRLCTKGFDPFRHEDLLANSPECRQIVAEGLVEEADALMFAGESRRALQRFDEACLYDTTAKLKARRQGFLRWAYKQRIRSLLPWRSRWSRPVTAASG